MKYIVEVPKTSRLIATTSIGDDVWIGESVSVSYDEALKLANEDNRYALGTDVHLEITFNGQEVMGMVVDDIVALVYELE